MVGPTLTCLSSTAAASLPFAFPFLSLSFFPCLDLAASPRLRRRAPTLQSSPTGPLLLRPTPHAARAPAPQSSRDRTAAPPPHADGPPGSSSSELAYGPLLLRLALPGHLSAPGPRHLPARAAAGSGGSGGGGARCAGRGGGARHQRRPLSGSSFSFFFGSFVLFTIGGIG